MKYRGIVGLGVDSWEINTVPFKEAPIRLANDQFGAIECMPDTDKASFCRSKFENVTSRKNDSLVTTKNVSYDGRYGC